MTALAEIHFDQCELRDAHSYATLALDQHQQTGHRPGEARTHLLLGRILHRTGAADAARSHWRQAHALFVDIGAPEASQTAALLTLDDSRCGAGPARP